MGYDDIPWIFKGRSVLTESSGSVTQLLTLRALYQLQFVKSEVVSGFLHSRSDSFA